MDQHPVTPPPDELVEQWREDNLVPENLANYVATQAARWGADQELEACLDWLDRNNQWAEVDLDELRDGRRPKPLSLKEQALLSIEVAVADGRLTADVYNLIRLALEKSIV